MHDIRALRDDPAAFARGWSSRGVADAQQAVEALLAADKDLRAAQTAFQEAQARRNEGSKLIGQAKAKKDDAEAQRLMAEVESLKGAITEHSEEEKRLAEQLHARLAELPNIPAPEVPTGADESGNVMQGSWGDPKILPAARVLSPKDHVDLGEGLAMMDFEAASRMAGARFVVLRSGLARLERALGQFMLDLQTGEHGYQETSGPVLVRTEALFGTGQLPKFAEDQFHTTDDRWLIPTAEVSLTNTVREQILNEEDLPLRLTALTPCFRAEAGASGRDTRGMIRQHQFWKVELVSITTPEQSDEEHERMLNCAEEVLKRLQLPYRTMLLCSGDMGFTAKKTYDLEVWLPSAQAYREISSCSNCGDFQARRMDTRSKKPGEKGARFVHTLNGSGLAVGRTLVAVMENYQEDDGRIAIPSVLQPYMGGLTHIG
ncbi:MAG TPA: serine--tRNA ligase [Caulobacteraceae bacterium]|jgi:seryl-tRNA synthetase